MREENRHRRPRQHAPGRTAQDELAHTRVPVGAHHQKVSIPRGDIRFERLANAPALRVKLVEHDVDAMPGEVAREFGATSSRRDVFSFTTVTTRTRFALSSSGRASATARAAGRLKSHAI